MITKLTLTNFKKHESLELNFIAGLTAMKGANEAGKSTIYHAIVYAMFGARALPLTLAETVTYDKPETTLKVELEFTFEGATYKITRSKSGAVITNGTVTANGQAEVTKFVEKLFGVNADAATKLMVASQGGLRGALESGEAVPLIEKLANIDLIDKLIAKIQDQLPSGNTKTIVDAIEAASQAVEPTLDTEDLAPAVAFTKTALELCEQELAELQAKDTIDRAAQQAIVDAVVATEQRWAQISKEVSEITDRIAIKPTPPSVDIDAAKDGYEKFKEHNERLKAYKQFMTAPADEVRVEAYAELLTENKEKLTTLSKAILSLKLTVSASKAMLITESACGLCGKDLTDVPEVVAKNAATQQKIEEAQDAIAKITVDLTTEQEKAEHLQRLKEADNLINSVFLVTQKHTTIDRKTVPATLIWLGGIPEEETVWPDYVAEIREGEKLLREYDKALAVFNELCEQQSRLLAEAKTLVVDTDAKIKAQGLIQDKIAMTNAIAAKREEVNKASLAYKDATSVLNQAVQRYEIGMESYRRSQEVKKGLEDSLAVMVKNNALIKKLREVRPVVASRLWSIVLASVSTYFSQIRGAPSVVTRSAASFSVGGKPVGGLSGSTLDALGLAIRMALSKTFLPSVDFMLLDEPAAGMDEERETAMLGLLAATGYNQVLVVTHSDLADSFATAVIQL